MLARPMEPTGRPLPDARGRRAAVRRAVGLALAFSGVAGGSALARIGRVYALSLAAGHAVLVGFRAAAGDPGGARDHVPTALGLVSLAAGLTAWAAARDVERDEAARGVTAALPLLGVTSPEERAARIAGTVLLVAGTVALPGLVVVAPSAFLAGTVGEALRMVALGALVVVYAACFGVVLGGLARLAAALAPTRGRALFFGVLVVPFAVGRVLPGFPDIASALAWALDRVADVGGRLG